MAPHFARAPRRSPPPEEAPALFRSLHNPRYRRWAAGSAVSSVGTWMQRIAQDWLVLTGLTHHNATAVGLIMALQFGPALLLLPLTGLAADRCDRRRLLLATQAAQGLLALALGLLTVAGHVTLWQVYAFALLLGVATAFDGPARQTFVSDLVGEADLANAVALNSATFNAARMVGPALAGVLIARIGAGGVFLVNAATFVAVIAALATLRPATAPRPPAGAGAADLGAGLRFLWRRADLRVMLFMLFLVATFGLNFPVFIATMAVGAFDADASRFGFLTTMMAAGSVAGALLTAHRRELRLAHLVRSAAVFGSACALAALAPGYGCFAVVLFLAGLSAQVFTTSSNSLFQLRADPAVRGRVMSIVMAIFLGTTPLGAPAVGWVADTFGPRWALAVAALSGLAAAALGLAFCRRADASPPAAAATRSSAREG